eukprot:6370840-Amphidinium_carterae.1
MCSGGGLGFQYRFASLTQYYRVAIARASETTLCHGHFNSVTVRLLKCCIDRQQLRHEAFLQVGKV